MSNNFRSNLNNFNGDFNHTTGFTPVGTVISYFGETAPMHYLICDGATYNKSDYPELWTHLSSLTDTTPYVVDGDNTKFKVPDLRGEFLRGSGTNSHANQGSGTNVGVHQDATELPNVWTYLYGNGEVGIIGEVTSNGSGSRFSKSDSDIITGTKKSGFYRGAATTGTGQEVATFTSRPTNTSVLFCIAYKDIYIDYALDGFPVDISNPQDKQGLTFDATTQKWVNGAGGMHEYSTTEKVVGTWIDGRPIYEKIIDLTLSQMSKAASYMYIYSLSDWNINEVINHISSVKQLGTYMIMPNIVFNDNGINSPFCSNITVDANNIILSMQTTAQSRITDIRCIIQYTKTTDTPTV